MLHRSIMELFDLSDKTAIVVGGTKGIGEAISLRLAEAGAAVNITGRDSATANLVVERIQKCNS